MKDPEYRPTLDTAAASLVTRYRPDAKVIQSWNSSKTWKGPVIIDNMMNLEQIALNHADATLKNHFRKDYSSYHVVDYDMSNGKVLKRATSQGAGLGLIRVYHGLSLYKR